MIRILVVDDNQTPREMICDTLKKYNIHVTEAVNGEEATKILETEKFNLVITDLIMPQMNGYELCRWIKNNPATEKTPVIICSTKGEDFDVYWATKQGADAYITKPFKAIELLKTVKYLIKHSSNS